MISSHFLNVKYHKNTRYVLSLHRSAALLFSLKCPKFVQYKIDWDTDEGVDQWGNKFRNM